MKDYSDVTTSSTMFENQPQAGLGCYSFKGKNIYCDF